LKKQPKAEFIKWLGTTGENVTIFFKKFACIKFQNWLSFISEISKAKVIDMTGREQRVLSGYSALSAKKAADSNDSDGPGINKDKFQLEKLSYNLETLVNFCEQVTKFLNNCLHFSSFKKPFFISYFKEIVENAKFLAHNEDQISTLESEMKNTVDFVAKEQNQIQMLTNVVEVLSLLERKRSDNTLDIDFLWEQMSQLESKYPEDFASYDLPQIVLTYLIPLMKSCK